MPLVLLVLTVIPMTYYIDADRGSDVGSGTSPKSPWRSAAPLARTTLRPGDKVLFRSGQRHRGGICLERLTGPVTVSSYGKGRATLDGMSGDGLILEDCASVTVKNLNLVGSGRENGNDGRGIQLRQTRKVRIEEVHVRGFRIAGIETGGDEDTLIAKVVAEDNGFAGISVYGGHDGLPRSKRVTIRDCVARNNPGDPKNLTNHSGNGIVVGGVDECLIERCVATQNGWDMPRKGNGPVGIWAWNADRVTIQRCISYGNRSPGADGGGFDFDGGVTNSVMQYNLSYGNEGCGYLLCQYPGARVWRNNVVRFNISYHDGSRNFQAGIGLWAGDSGISGAQIYNNTIVNPDHAIGSLGALPGFVYRNNLFVCDGDVLDGEFAQSRFEGNLYWTKGNVVKSYRTVHDWGKATGQETVDGSLVACFGDPRLVLPSRMDELPTEPRELASMRFFRSEPGSRASLGGVRVPFRGARDFAQRPLKGLFLGAIGPSE